MTWDSAVTLVQLTFGKANGTLGESATSQVTLTPIFTGTRYLVWTATNAIWEPTTITGVAPVGMMGSIQAPAVDQNGWVDEFGNAYKNWSYLINASYSVAGSNLTITRNFALGSGTGPIDIDITPSSGSSIPQIVLAYPVKTVNGVAPDSTGNVVVAGGGGGSGTPGITSRQIKTSGFTGAASVKYAVDATAGAIAVPLPTTNTITDQIVIQKTDTSANLVTFSGKIDGVTSATGSLRTQNQGKIFQGDGTGNWNIIAGDVSVSALDTRYAPISATGAPQFVFTQANIGGVGDGATDNTAAWNRAMALLEVAGGELKFPLGIYCINGVTNTVPGGSMLVGTGMSFSDPSDVPTSGAAPARGAVIRATASMARLISLGRNQTTSYAADTSASMRDLIVDGQNLASIVVQTNGRRNYIYNCQVYWGGTVGVDLNGQNSYLIGGVVCQDVRGDCVRAMGGNDPKILDTQLRQCGTSTGACLRISASDVLVRGNHIYTGANGVPSSAQALIVVQGSAKIIGIYNNIIEVGISPEILLQGGTSGINISGNQFFNASGTGNGTQSVVVANGASSSDTLSDVIVSNNIVMGVAGVLYKALVEYKGTFGSTNGWIIEGNQCFNTAALVSGTVPTNPQWGFNGIYSGSARLKSSDSGTISFTGDGVTTTFTIPTNLASPPQYVHAQSASAAAGAAGIAYTSVTGNNILVTMKTAPVAASTVTFAWTATMNGNATVVTPADTTAPTVPGTPTATAGTNQIALAWTASTDAVGVTGYHVYRSDAPTTAIGTPTTNAYTDTTAVAGTPYTYTVSAFDAAANESAKSAASNSATATSSAGTLTNTTAPAVTGSTAVGGVLTTTNGSWSATPDSYTYQWNRGGGAISGATSSTYTTVTADGGTTVTCVVTAIKATYTNGTATSNGIAVVASGVTNFLNDTFTTGTTGDLGTHTANSGGGYVKNTVVATGSGAFTVSAGTNDLYNGSANSSAYAANGSTPPSADYTVEADFIVKSLPASTSMGIAVRMTAATGYAYVFRYATSGSWNLQKFVNSGSSTAVGTAFSQTLTVGQTYHAKLVVSGTTLTAYVDGTQVVTATDASIAAAGFPGVYYTGAVTGTDTAGIHLDNLVAHA